MSRSTLFALLALSLTACKPRVVVVRVTVPDLDGVETPVAGLVFRLLPYDRDSVIRSLEAKAGPRPHTRALDSLFQRFRGPFTALLLGLRDEERLRTRRAALQKRRDRELAGSAARAGTEAELRGVQNALDALAPELARARAALERARVELYPQIDSLRRDAQHWEKTAYEGYEDLVRNLARSRYANIITDTTGADGWVAITLPRGRWWISATAIDLHDPNAGWYWNLEMTRDTVLLNPLTGQNRPRY